MVRSPLHRFDGIKIFQYIKIKWFIELAYVFKISWLQDISICTIFNIHQQKDCTLQSSIISFYTFGYVCVYLHFLFESSFEQKSSSLQTKVWEITRYSSPILEKYPQPFQLFLLFLLPKRKVLQKKDTLLHVLELVWTSGWQEVEREKTGEKILSTKKSTITWS